MVKIIITKKSIYVFAIVLGILSLGISVYAYNYPGLASVMGHTMNELTPPAGSGFVTFSSGAWVNTANLPPTCTGDRETVRYNAATRMWSCGSVGYECSWTGWSPSFYPSRFSDPNGCYYIDECYVESDCSTELCAYYLDGIAMVPPPEWQVYANPVQQIECISGEVTQMRYVSVCPSDATANCGWAEMTP